MRKRFSYLFAVALISLNWSCNKDENDTQTVVIEGIVLVDIINTNNGEPWDISPEGVISGPDIYWTLSGPQDFSSSVWLTDANSDQIIFTGNEFPIELSKDETYTLSIYNKNNLDETDAGEDDELMTSTSVRGVGIDCPEGYIAAVVVVGGYYEWECFPE